VKTFGGRSARLPGPAALRCAPQVMDGLRVSIFRNLEVLLLKTGQGTWFLPVTTYVEHDNARSCLETPGRRSCLAGSLAVEQRADHQKHNAMAKQER